jgi:hypothetical protein
MRGGTSEKPEPVEAWLGKRFSLARQDQPRRSTSKTKTRPYELECFSSFSK